MKSLYTFLLLLITVSSLNAQSPEIDKVDFLFDYSENDLFNHFVTNDQGNIFIAGDYYQSAVVFGDTITGFDMSYYFGEMDADGNLLWKRNLFTNDDLYLSKMVVGPSGNLFLAGRFRGTFSIDGTTLVSAVYDDIYLMELNPANGQLIRIKQFTSTYNDFADHDIASIAFDASGNVYVAGYFSEVLTCESTTINASGLGDMLLAKLDPSFNLVWMKAAGGTYPSDCGLGNRNDFIADIALDQQGNIFATGHYVMNSDFGGIIINSPNGVDAEAFIAKFANDGTCLWAENIAGTSWQLGKHVVVDSKGDAYVAGEFQQKIIMGTDTMFCHPYDPQVGGNHYDAMLMKFSSTGGLVRMQNWGGPASEYVLQLLIDPADNLYITGNISDNAIVGGTTHSYGSFNNNDTRGLIIEFDSLGSYSDVTVFGGYTSNAVGLAFDAGYNLLFAARTSDYLDVVFDSFTFPAGSGAPDWHAYLVRREKSNNLQVGMDALNIGEFSFAVYPNPSSGSFMVETTTSQPFELSVIDLSGKEIYRQTNVLYKTQVMLGHMDSGMYFVILESESTRAAKAIVID